METLKGTIRRIIFQNIDSGFKVLKIQTQSGPILTITGEFGPEIISGAIVNFHGDFKQHPKYGTNFRAKSYTISHDIEKLSSIKLFLDDIAPNIGPERAQLIVNHFGEEIIYILENESDRLMEIPGIGKISAKSLSQAWNKNKDLWNHKRVDYSLRAFLNSLGIRERRVKKILNYFGGGLEAEEAIRENPYILTEIESFGFSSADFIARQLGISENDPIRLRAFLLHSLKTLCLSYGHLYLSIENCLNLIRTFCLENNTSFINKNILISDDLNEPIKSLEKEGLIINDNNILYSKENYLSESRAAELITSILLKPSDLIFLTKDYVDSHIENFERENRLILSAEQKQALHYFVEKKVFIITGAAGTGKTMILKAIVDLVRHLRLTLTCLTPTGISAKKMASTVGFDAYTIHRRLGFRGNNWIYNENNKYDTDLIIVDEVSMVDMDVFYRLLAAIRDRTHLIFVGDDNQLPSVGAGNVLKELIKSQQFPVVKLEQIFRQSETSDIIKAAHKIKKGDTDLSLFKPDPTSDVFFIREKNIEEIEKFIVKLAQKFKNERRSFQIISARNEGPLSVNTLNDILQKVLNPPGIEAECSLGHFLIRRGDRVIIIKNDYELDVFNGEIGKIIQISGGFITIQFDDKTVEINIEEAAEKIKLAYCLTIHRCLPENTFISTSEGFKKISLIKQNDKVCTIEEFNKVKWHGQTGEHEIIQIVTERGYTVESSLNHRFLIANKNEEYFQKAKDIKIGSFACIDRNKIEGKEILLQFNNIRGNGTTPRKNINLPHILSPDIAWLLGALIGNGSYRDKKDGLIEISSPINIEILDEFKKIVSSFGLNVKEHLKKGERNSVYVCSKNLRAWLYSFGYDYIKAENKKIPEKIFQATLSNRLFFIAGLIDTDGSVSPKGLIRYVTVSNELAYQLQLLLLSCGIISSVLSQVPKKTEEKKKYCVVLNMRGGLEFKKYLKCVAKRKKLNLKENIGKNTTDRKIPYGGLIAQQIIKLFNPTISRGKKNKGLNSNEFKNMGRIYGVKNEKIPLTYTFLEKVIKMLERKNITPPQNILDIFKRNILYDKIKFIKYTNLNKPTYDMEINKKQIYIANGFICHNSQGQEYPITILPFINQFGKNMLQRNLLYTAITRAKEKVIVIGHGTALEKAINNSSVYERNTKLGERIKECILKRKKIFLVKQPSELENSLIVASKKELSLSDNREELSVPGTIEK